MKLKTWKFITVMLVALALVTAVAFTVYAYFSTQVYVYTNDGDKQKLELGMNLQLLFDKLDENLEGANLKIPYYELRTASGALPSSDNPDNTVYYNYYQNPESDSYVAPIFDPDAPWGSPQNPYIISNERHLQNLSTLQRVGYFDMTYIGNNYTESGSGDSTAYTYNGGISMPYFLVCNATTGAPVVIDGTEIGAVRPIGSAEHPFIGVIGGAFTSGEVSVGTTGKTVSLSTLHNIQVRTDVKQVDVGLFGYVGYMGNAPADGETEEYEGADGNIYEVLVDDFEGVASIIQNLVLSDVQVVVNKPTVAESISNFFANLFGANHRFSYTGLSDEKISTVYHETNHIGILAGHVSYASVEYISVYYSSGDICAIDLLDTENGNVNYHSTTGIVGFMHKMNASITNEGTATAITGNCRISISGTSSDDVILNPGGSGSGGGPEIGLGRGYVMAKTLYNGYHYVSIQESDNQALGDRVWKYTSGSTSGYAMMVFQNPGAETYVDQDGQAVTLADTTATIKGVVYKSFIVRRVTGSGTANDPYVYSYWVNNTTEIDQTDCYELAQTIWQYAATEPEEVSKPTWEDAVMLYETGVGTESYTLPSSIAYGGSLVAGAVVTVSSKTGGGYKATIPGTTIYNADANKVVEIGNVIFYRMITPATEGKSAVYTCSLTPTGEISAPYSFREKPLLIRYAKTMYGTELCVESTEGLTLAEGKLGNFFFYDGVFTFALSSAEDTIESTWENDTPDKIVLGTNNDSSWEANTSKGNKIVIAYIKPIKTELEWQTVLANKQEIFIGYHNAYTTTVTDANGKDISWVEQPLNLMSLATSTSGDGWESLFDDASSFTLNSIQKKFVSAKDRQSLIDAMLNNEDGAFPEENTAAQNNSLLQGLINGDIQILNLQSSDDLNTLKNQYKIIPSAATDGSGGTTFTGQTSNKYQLCLVQGTGRIFGSTSYSVWCGSSKPSNNFLYTFDWDNSATVNQNGDVFQISYGNKFNVTERYVGYSSNKFQGTTSATNLYFYTIEAMTTADYGSITFDPVETDTNAQSFSADKYILWPQAVLKQDGTYVNGTLDSSLPHDASDTKTDDTNATNNIYKSYNLVDLETLISGNAGWQDGQGGPLDKTDLSKKFTMQEAIQFGASLKLPSGTNIQIDDGSVLAPVGPGGAYANIPTGSIAFRINKEGASTIRVIVSVPVSQFYDNQGGGQLYTNYDYYLGLWKTEDLADDGSWQLNAFNQTSAVQKFELPRSRPYEPGTNPGDADYILVKNGSTTYRCYLNGERVLVGYEFSVSEPGTYILGTAIGETSYGDGIFDSILGMLGGNVTESEYQYPMEIVYASADGTASPGNDGTSSSIYGSIDYVYSYNNKIVHVQDYDDSESGDYSRYYNSNRITFTQNELLKNEDDSTLGFVNIQNFQAFVWRTVETDDNGASKIYLNISVKSTQDAVRALLYYRSAGYDPDEIRITVSARS